MEARRWIGRCITAGVAAAALASGMASTRTLPLSAAQSLHARPNIVMLMTDDQTLESMRVMPKTRKLIGAEGVTFTNAIVTTPLCCPARAGYFTGQYAHNDGVFFNHGPNGGYAAFHHQETAFPVALQRGGHYTALIGKYLNGYGTKDPIPPGWSDFDATFGWWSYNYYGYRRILIRRPRVLRPPPRSGRDAQPGGPRRWALHRGAHPEHEIEVADTLPGNRLRWPISPRRQERAPARQCTVHLTLNDRLLIEVRDDGVGLPADWHPGLGTTPMKERATEVGGACEIVSSTGGGTALRVHLPLVEQMVQ